MRLITIGCEYSGKTALTELLRDWGREQGRHFHIDDGEFSMPDIKRLNVEEQKAVLALPPKVKERYQRFQIYYHIHVLHDYDDCILGGYHIEESIYGPRYYYPEYKVDYARKIESKLPEDTVLVLLTSSPHIIRERMKHSPHPYPLVDPSEVEETQREFEIEFGRSWIKRKMRFDTSDIPQNEMLERFLEAVKPQLSSRDLQLIYP